MALRPKCQLEATGFLAWVKKNLVLVGNGIGDSKHWIHATPMNPQRTADPLSLPADGHIGSKNVSAVGEFWTETW